MKRAKSASCAVFKAPDLLNLICTFLHPEELVDNRIVCRGLSHMKPRWLYLSDSGNFASRSDSKTCLDINHMLKLADSGSLRGLHCYRGRLASSLTANVGLRELIIDMIDTFRFQNLPRYLPGSLVRLSLDGNLAHLKLGELVVCCPNLEELILMGRVDFSLCSFLNLKRLSIRYSAPDMEACLQFVSMQRLTTLHLDCDDLHYFPCRLTDPQLSEYSENAPWHLLPSGLRVLGYDWKPPRRLLEVMERDAFGLLLCSYDMGQDDAVESSKIQFIESFFGILDRFEQRYPFI